MYFGITGKQYSLPAVPMKAGGEGSVFAVNGNPSLLAKIYHPNVLDQELEEKLKTMYQNPPAQDVLSQIAWPIDVLYDDKRNFSGFLMRKLKVTHELKDIYEYPPTTLKSVTLQHKLIIAQNICLVISAVHKAGYVFGDFNPMNIGVNLNDGTVAFFDADTYHFKDSRTGHMHRCKAGCPGYVAPELIVACRKYSASHPGDNEAYAHAPLPTFTVETDNFALAVHIFKLLMNGYTPYNGIPEATSASLASPGQGDVAVERNNYCFAPGKKPLSAATPELSSLPPDIQALFSRAFEVGYGTPSARPSAGDWRLALYGFEQKLRQCPNNPNHLFYHKLSGCPYCAADLRYEQEMQLASAPPLTQKKFTSAPKVQAPASPAGHTSGQSPAAYVPLKSSAAGAATQNAARQNAMALKTKAVIAVVIVAIVIVFITIMKNVDRDSVDFTSHDVTVAVGETVQVRVSSTTSKLSARFSNNIDAEWNNSKQSGKYYYLDVTGISEGRAELLVFKRDNEKISDSIIITVVASQGEVPGAAGDIGSSTTETSKEHTSKDTALSIDVNLAVSDSLQSDGASNWYAFSLAEPGCVALEFEHDQVDSSDDYWRLYLYRDDGSTFYDGGSRYWSVPGDEGLATCSIGLPAGTYFLRIAPDSSAFWSSNNYTVTVSFTPTASWECELNNDKYSANVVAVNSACFGAITSTDDRDWYEFSLAKDGYINLYFEHGQVNSTDAYWQLHLYRDDGSTYYDGGSRSWSVSGESSLTTCDIGLPAGTYYLRVAPYASYRWSSNTYNFTINYIETDVWEKETNNDKYSANRIDTGINYYGTISSENDKDWYAFDLASPGVLDVSFSHTQVESSDAYWNLYLYRDDGSTYYDGSSNYWQVPGDEGLTTSDIGLPAGTYYLRISPYASYRWTSRSYNFTINYTPSNAWETELNNSKYDADEVLFNTYYFGTNTNGGDKDWYSFTLGSTQTISIAFSHDQMNSSDTYWELYLYQADGSTNATGTSHWSVAGDADRTISGITLSPGTYYFKVAPYASYHWTSRNYSFIIQ